jgi:hypothetical protein
MYRATTLLTLLAVALAGGNCQPSSTLAWDGATRDSTGIQVVENFGTPLWKEGEGWEFSRRLRIGVADGDSAYMFGNPSGAVILSDGRVVVGDALYHNLRFFSPEGSHLFTVGTEGTGPGEFGGTITLLLGPGDSVLAVDSYNRRANHIAPDGIWLGSFSTVPSKGYGIWSWDDDRTTGVIASLLRPQRGDAAPSDPRFDLLVRRDFSGAFLDTLTRIPTTGFRTGGRGAELAHFYRGGPAYDLCSGMIVTGHSDEFRILWQRPDGTVERVVTLDRAPLALTGHDETTLLRRIDALAQESGWPQERAAQFKSRIRFESAYPAYRSFVCGPAGTLLVQRIRPLRELSEQELQSLWPTGIPPGSDEWDVFDRDGRYLGVALLPVTPHRQAFAQDTSGVWLMLGLERGELDVPYVEVWHIDGIEQ